MRGAKQWSIESLLVVFIEPKGDCAERVLIYWATKTPEEHPESYPSNIIICCSLHILLRLLRPEDEFFML
jgi:hypothetical protein